MEVDNQNQVLVPGFINLATFDGLVVTIAVTAVKVVAEHEARTGNANSVITLIDGDKYEIYETREQVMRLIYKAAASPPAKLPQKKLPRS